MVSAPYGLDDPLPFGEEKTMVLLQEAAGLFDDYNSSLGV